MRIHIYALHAVNEDNENVVESEEPVKHAGHNFSSLGTYMVTVTYWARSTI